MVVTYFSWQSEQLKGKTNLISLQYNQGKVWQILHQYIGC